MEADLQNEWTTRRTMSRLFAAARWQTRTWWGELQGQPDRVVAWLPVILGAGVGGYFLLPLEPAWPWLGAAVGFALALLGLSWQSYSRRAIAGLLLAFSLGFLVAKVETDLQAASLRLLDYRLYGTTLTGTLKQAESQVRGSRVLLTDIQLEDTMSKYGLPSWARNNAPTGLTLRISLPRVTVANLPPAGTRLRLKADLRPPAGPSQPGAYDFRRQAFFQGLSGYGFSLTIPEVVAPATKTGFTEWAEGIRQTIAAKVALTLSGPEAAIAIALLTGERGAIDNLTNDNLRAAGTAHILSISGMHIGMVAGVLFFFIRFGLALVPGLALRWPIKKIAAAGALVGILLYTALVGSPVAAERAALMTGFILFAIIVDRISLSLRAIALAAGLLLLVHPSSLLHPGFQLSFAAMVVLIGYYEHLQRQPLSDTRPNIGQRLWRGTRALVFTSLLAALATAPLGLYHFHRLQLLGVMGNLLAVPLTGFVVMPAAVLAYLLMPFGAAEWPLKLMGWGLEGVLDSASIIATWPGANLDGPPLPLPALILIALAGLWAVIWQGSVRWLAILPLGLALPLIFFSAKPTILVSDEGLWAVRTNNGQLYFGETQRQRLTVADWQRTYGQPGRPQTAKRAAVETGLKCAADVCIYTHNGQLIALTSLREAQQFSCPQDAAWLIAPRMYVENCPVENIVDRRTLKEKGSAALFSHPTGLRVVYAGEANRPWSRQPTR